MTLFYISCTPARSYSPNTHSPLLTLSWTLIYFISDPHQLSTIHRALTHPTLTPTSHTLLNTLLLYPTITYFISAPRNLSAILRALTPTHSHSNISHSLEHSLTLSDTHLLHIWPSPALNNPPSSHSNSLSLQHLTISWKLSYSIRHSPTSYLTLASSQQFTELSLTQLSLQNLTLSWTLSYFIWHTPTSYLTLTTSQQSSKLSLTQLSLQPLTLSWTLSFSRCSDPHQLLSLVLNPVRSLPFDLIPSGSYPLALTPARSNSDNPGTRSLSLSPSPALSAHPPLCDLLLCAFTPSGYYFRSCSRSNSRSSSRSCFVHALTHSQAVAQANTKTLTHDIVHASANALAHDHALVQAYALVHTDTIAHIDDLAHTDTLAYTYTHTHTHTHTPRSH